MKRFEYKVEDIQVSLKQNQVRLEDFEEKLNALGEQGWEMTGVNGTLFYFKRELE
ncbi:hypothetical protein LCM20_08900 [Halobacillus litoralis]|uniref:hypothetical protein n=1 Tax=Halobacillus litoralis TaxID=45668 RepID=UPI001CD6A77F|nr:hypothetical protein [Halobacillus litoralis]MCA0970704.1 hypothetical protein [Halobacillus litoralis]